MEYFSFLESEGKEQVKRVKLFVYIYVDVETAILNSLLILLKTYLLKTSNRATEDPH